MLKRIKSIVMTSVLVVLLVIGRTVLHAMEYVYIQLLTIRYLIVQRIGMHIAKITYIVVSILLGIKPKIYIIQDKESMMYYACTEAQDLSEMFINCGDDNILGWHNVQDAYIVVPVYRNINIYCLIDTVAHEMRHAWQTLHGWDNDDVYVAYKKRPREKDAIRFGSIVANIVKAIVMIALGIVVGIVISTCR